MKIKPVPDYRNYLALIKSPATIYLVCIVAISSALGIAYSIYNTDPHHWGFIAGTALDFIKGRKLFSEVFVQYGAGEPLLFKIINGLLPINYTRVGIITSMAYAINLFVIYLSLNKISTPIIALLVTTIAFLLHPYAIYPWPDYYAGFCVTLACYFMLGNRDKEGRIQYIISGILFFAAFIFRNTYLVNILLAMASYVVLSVLFKRSKNNKLIITCSVFSVLTIGYFIFLFLQGNLHFWYVQGIGASSEVYGSNLTSALILIQSILLPTDFVRTLFSVLFILNAYTVFVILMGNKLYQTSYEHSLNENVIFLGLLGAAGFVQCLQIYEIFRLQNACSSLYLVVAYFLTNHLDHKNGVRLPVYNSYFAIGLVVIALITFFPNASSLFPVMEGSSRSYRESNIPFYKGHKFRPPAQVYYRELSNYICKEGKQIVNLTPDSTIPYLCAEHKNALYLPFYSDQLLRNIDIQQADRIRSSNFNNDEVIVTMAPPPLPNLNWIGKVDRPASIRFFGAAEVHIYQVGPISENLRSVVRVEELLQYPDFYSTEGWVLGDGVQYDSNEHTIKVSDLQHAAQTVKVIPGSKYQLSATVRCVTPGAIARLQINWLDKKDALIRVDLAPVACSKQFEMHAQSFYAPNDAVSAVVYAAAHSVGWIEYKSLSLKEE